MTNRLIQRTILMILGFVICTHFLIAQVDEKIPVEKNGLPKSYPIHASDILWKRDLEVQKFIKEHPEALLRNSLHKTAGYGINSTKDWYADDLSSSEGLRYKVPSTCKAVGTNCYIFVENASWGKYITQNIVDSMRIYFDSKTPANAAKGIYQTDVDVFGNPPDVDNDPKIVILLLNILDGYSGSGGYVEGYFSPFNEMNPSSSGYSTSNFTEMFYIDVNPTNLATPDGLYSAISTLAHEFQHMIHWNYDKYEMSFVNEGCSLLAEVNCGFPIYSQSYYASEPNHYLLDWRHNDNTGVLYDYSRAARFFVYLRDQFGMGLFKPLVASMLIGTEGIDAGLKSISAGVQFSDVLKNWFIANILDDRTVDPKYGYIYQNLPNSTAKIYYNPNVALTTDTVNNYAVRYISFKKGSQLKATFIVSNPALIIKAVEIGPSLKRVVDVSSGVEFSELLYGSTYTEIDFVIMNTNPSSPYSFTYQASGVQQSVELGYPFNEPTQANIGLVDKDSICVVFDAVQDGSLDSIRVALRRDTYINGGIWKYTGAPLPTPLGQQLTTFTIKGDSTPTSNPYPVPWPNWVTVDLRVKKISTNSAFAVGFIIDGTYPTDANVNRVMIKIAPIGNGSNSLSYDQSGPSGPRWYFYVSNNAGDSAYYYLIRAYVSFPASVLYPGDANNDGIVDARDILPIGLYYGKTGSPRIGGSNTWQKQYINQSWTPEQAVYADCDGNGKIDSNDVIAIIQNWNATPAGGVPAGLVRSAICQELLQEIDRNGATGPMRSIRNAISSYMNQSLVEQVNNVPLSFALYQNYPNPFNPSTTIHFILPQKMQEVRLSIFNILGQLVWEKVLTGIEAGTHDVSWAGETFSGYKVGSGIYIYRLKAGSYNDVKKMILIK